MIWLFVIVLSPILFSFSVTLLVSLYRKYFLKEDLSKPSRKRKKKSKPRFTADELRALKNLQTETENILKDALRKIEEFQNEDLRNPILNDLSTKFSKEINRIKGHASSYATNKLDNDSYKKLIGSIFSKKTKDKLAEKVKSSILSFLSEHKPYSKLNKNLKKAKKAKREAIWEEVSQICSVSPYDRLTEEDQRIIDAMQHDPSKWEPIPKGNEFINLNSLKPGNLFSSLKSLNIKAHYNFIAGAGGLVFANQLHETLHGEGVVEAIEALHEWLPAWLGHSAFIEELKAEILEHLAEEGAEAAAFVVLEGIAYTIPVVNIFFGVRRLWKLGKGTKKYLIDKEPLQNMRTAMTRNTKKALDDIYKDGCSKLKTNLENFESSIEKMLNKWKSEIQKDLNLISKNQRLLGRI